MYDKHLELKYQRWRNNPTQPRPTDQEVVTIYLFGVRQGRLQQTEMHKYIRDHWAASLPAFAELSGFQSSAQSPARSLAGLARRVNGAGGDARARPSQWL
jgi:hypothetical protein